MPRRSKGKVEIKIRLYPGRDDELIQWQAQFDDQPYGVKTQAVKEALRKGTGVEALQAKVVAPALDLVEVRRVVEAAVATALGRFEGQMVGAAAETPDEGDDEVEDLLEGFQYSLVLGEDE
ncbi:hypothetical protein ACFLUM_01700 [Chloroflexota bacterium]